MPRAHLRPAIVPAQTAATSTCSANCGGTCVLHLVVADGRIVRVLPDAEHTPCLKGPAQHQNVYDPDRLRYPLRRN